MSVTFATTCWERDWRFTLRDPDYLASRQIDYHCHQFKEKLLIINDVEDLNEVIRAAEKLIREGVLTRYVVAGEEMLAHFGLTRKDFKGSKARDPDFVYYNALGPLVAIASCRTEYLLYQTGDTQVIRPCQWIDKAIALMRKDPIYKLANLVWDGRYFEARSESFEKDGEFYVSMGPFTDQMFLIKRDDFLAPIFGEEREESEAIFNADIFEKRVFCAMRNRGWKRLTYDSGAYVHQNIFAGVKE